MTAPTALHTSQLHSLPLLARGKVRDNYAVGSDRILMVASDRISAFDVIMGQPIPGKGALLTQMALWWFEQLKGIVPNHLTGDAPESVVKQLQPARLAEPATVPCAPDASQSLVRAAIVSPRNDEAMLEQLTDLVQAQGLYKDPDLSLIKLARRMGVPARELSAMVNRQCGKNIAQWINGFRIAAACEQLASSDTPVTTVMLDCGFFTKSNFNREFRRHTGLSPSAYRQQLRSWAKQAAQTS